MWLLEKSFYGLVYMKPLHIVKCLYYEASMNLISEGRLGEYKYNKKNYIVEIININVIKPK